MKDQVFALYGYAGYDDARCVADAHGKTCEIDHLISSELGGADDVQNLWPEAYGTSPWNAHLKDKLEKRCVTARRTCRPIGPAAAGHGTHSRTALPYRSNIGALVERADRRRRAVVLGFVHDATGD